MASRMVGIVIGLDVTRHPCPAGALVDDDLPAARSFLCKIHKPVSQIVFSAGAEPSTASFTPRSVTKFGDMSMPGSSMHRYLGTDKLSNEEASRRGLLIGLLICESFSSIGDRVEGLD